MWHKVIWFKGHVPRLAVILWMAYRKRMLTKEKLKRWGSIQDDQCVLCYAAMESQNHLFFIVFSLNAFGEKF